MTEQMSRSCYHCIHCKVKLKLRNVRRRATKTGPVCLDKMIVYGIGATTRCTQGLWILGDGRQHVLKRLPLTPDAVKQLEAAERCGEFETW